MKILDFLNCKRAEEELKRIVQDTSFETMKNRPLHRYAEYWRICEEKTDEKLFQKGKVGSWMDELS